jgi:phosphogluconate dehydratase
MIRLDGHTGELCVLLSDAELAPPAPARRNQDNDVGCRPEQLAIMRQSFSSAEQGASAFTSSLESLQ